MPEPRTMSGAEIRSTDDLAARAGAAIGQSPQRSGRTWSYQAAGAAPGLDADLFFAFPGRPELGLRVWFEESRVLLEPGAGSPLDTISGSPEAWLDFFGNRRSPQALLLEGEWRIGGNAGQGAGDADEIRDYVRHLETLLPPAYRLPPEVRERVLASATAAGRDVTVESRPPMPASDFVVEFVRGGRPVVLRGAVEGLRWWSFGALKERFAGIHTHLSRYPDCSYSIPECIDRIVSGSAESFKAALPLTRSIRERYSLPAYFPPGSVFEKAQALLLAPADDRMPPGYRATAWHCDWADNLLAQLIGTKRVRVASPVEGDRFQLRRTHESSHNVATDHSPLDSRRDLREEGIAVREVLLEPGDLLFLPCGWLHTVENLTPTAGINCWRIRPPEMLELGR